MGVTQISVKQFLSHITEKVHWELFDVSEIFWQRKLLKNARRDTTFFRRAIFVSQYREISLGTLRCFKNFRLAKKLHGREREGDTRFFRCTFSVSQFRKLALGTLRCFRTLLTANILYGCKVGYHVFTSNFFSPTLPKTFIGNSSSLQKNSGSGKIVWMREGDFTFSRRVFFRSFYQKLSLGNLRCFRKRLAVKRICGFEEDITFSVRFFSPDLYENFFWELFGASNYFWQRKDCMDGGRGFDVFFRRNIFESQYRNIFWALFGVSNFFWYGKKHILQDGGISNFRQLFFVS